MDAEIYKLICEDGWYYIGGCLGKSELRLYVHKAHSVRFPERKIYKHINKLGWEKVKLEVLVKFTVESKEELRLIEDGIIEEEIENEKCLNSIRAYLTPDRLKEMNKAKTKKYREKLSDAEKRESKERSNTARRERLKDEKMKQAHNKARREYRKKKKSA
jgi:hypothetical protein